MLGRSELTTLILSEAEVADLVERMLRNSGRRVDLSTPFVDAMLSDGSRLHVVIPSITRRHMAVKLVKYGQEPAQIVGPQPADGTSAPTQVSESRLY